MMASKLVRLVEEHSEQIADAVLERVRKDRGLTQLAGLPRAELRDQSLEILRNLGHWLGSSKESEVAHRFQKLGRLRRNEEVPLHESVRVVMLLKEQMLDHVRNQGITQSSVDLYAEEELEHQAGLFFDALIYNVVKGYEGAAMPRDTTRRHRVGA